MARGSLRAASQNVYRGAAGATRQAHVHVTLPSGEVAAVPVYTAIDVGTDPELGQRLLSDDPARALNGVRLADGTLLPVMTPVVYHDPANELMVLVLAEGDRHRELAERARLLAEMASDVTTPVPRYAREFEVVFAARGLRAFLEDKAEKAVAATRAGDVERELEKERQIAERRRAELTAHFAELERRRAEVTAQASELERRRAEVTAQASELERRRAEVTAQAGEVERRRAEVTAQAGELERRRAEVTAQAGELERRRAEVGAQAGELERLRGELDRRAKELDRRTAEVDLTGAELDRVRAELEHTRPDRAGPDAGRAGDGRPVDTRPDGARPGTTRPQPARPETARPQPARPETARPQPARPETARPQAARPEPALPPHDDAATGPFELGSEVTLGGGASHQLDLLELGSGEIVIGSGELLLAEIAVGDTDDDLIPTANQAALALHDEPAAPTALAELPAGSDPVSTTTTDAAAAAPDAWLQTFIARNSDAAIAAGEGDEPGVRLALRVPAGIVAALARGPLDLRLQLHRTPAYPVITLTVGTPASLRGVAGSELHRVTASLDVAAEVDRKALGALCRRFALTVDLVGDGRRVRRAVLVAPLEENAAYVTRAAQDHLRSLSAEANSQIQPSLAAARQQITAAGYDLLGAQHPEASEFRDDKLAQLGTANQVRRALAIARRFTRPAREDYLVTIRGYPLARWHERRREVLARAVQWGLWMGPELAQGAVSEGLARSRKDLVGRLQTAFAGLLADAVANDLDSDAAEDNRNAIDEEARSLGLAAGNGRESRTVASDAVVAASGTIERAPVKVEIRGRSVDELLALLDDRTQRVAAALELCDRGDPRAVRPVLGAIRRMGRAEAVRVLGAVVKFGEDAAPALTAGLGSSKAFLRHGCALALGMLRTEAGTEAVIDLLLSEPTEIWRELARAVGQIGPSALMPLAARAGRNGDRATGGGGGERVAWAMAHVGVRGGRNAVEALAGGNGAVAPVARQALELMAPAAEDDLRGTGPGREITVNRAFSRKFFEALGHSGLAGAASVELDALDASGPMELLDEGDLITVGGIDDEAELDESDLIDA